MNQSSIPARLLLAVGAALVALALAAPASAAEPKPGYTQFAGCPTTGEVPTVVLCIRSEINGGHFQMGNKDVPIANPMTLTGGITDVSVGEKLVYNSEGGLTPVKQLVPGGLVGLTGLDWLVDFLGLEGLKVYAVTEIAGPSGTAGSPLKDPFVLPIKVHLENPALGKNCYVGSNSNPIALNLTRGTTSPPAPNEPISGKQPAISFNFLTGITTLTDGILVDNAFAAPKSNGCQLEIGFIKIGIDTLLSATSGLPAAAGTNETIQEFDGSFVGVGRVY